MTEMEIKQRTQRLRSRMGKAGFTRRQIRMNRLDNPLMSEEARRILMNDIWREGGDSAAKAHRGYESFMGDDYFFKVRQDAARRGWETRREPNL